MLQSAGLATGESPENWNLEHPDRVAAVHRAYCAAGADFVLANTFGASPAKYHGPHPLDELIAAGVRIAREAAGPVRPVALDLGPSGRLLKPTGDFEFDAACDSFAAAVRAGAAAGADLIVVETMSDLYETKAAVLAAKENCSLPVVVTVAFDTSGKLLTGADPETVAVLLESLRVDAMGLNCGLGPGEMVPLLKRMAAVSSLPLMVKPNAGMPRIVDGRTVFLVGPDEFADDIAALVDAGATIVGGCCGTTPQHIAAVAARLAGRSAPPRRERSSVARVTSGSRTVAFMSDDTVIIGERINPTGKKALKEAYRSGDVGYVLRTAVAQVEAGAQVLDVNAGVPGIDEPAVLDATVQAIQGVTDAPLQIDTSDYAAMERALRHYNGRPLVNSVNGKPESLAEVLPLAARYGAIVVALTLDEQGIPETADGRLAIARRILDEGARHGLHREDFLIDPLCLAVSAEPNSANVILESLRRIRTEFGCGTILGVSNISFGLPARAQLNAAFYTLSLGAGLTAAIVNPQSPEMLNACRAWRALTGCDRACAGWIAAAESGEIATASVAPAPSASALPASAGASGSASVTFPVGTVGGAIVRGLKQDAAAAALAALAGGRSPLDVIDAEIVPALEHVGGGFERGRVFLSQLLMSADAAAAAFAELAAKMPASESKRGPIIVATVKGDIHDIGKNIVRALLENYGFKVIDLGRDVPPEKIVEAAVREKCRLVGLSALMTTTVGYMAETIRQLAAADPEIKTFVGGAVLTADYAAEIKATWYAKDAMASVRIAEAFFR